MQTKPEVSDPLLFIHGHGSVSSAGLDSVALYRAVVGNTEIPKVTLEHSFEGKVVSYPHRAVDSGALKAVMPKHPRLRRASNVTKFAVTAASQAIGQERLERMRNRELHIGIIVSFMNGCVNYSSRFFGEVLTDPSLASPILFPETVFNAPASHIAAFLDCDGPVYTLIGDTATWFSAVSVAENWISAGLVDGCLVLCAEETDWLTLEALNLYSRELVGTEGAAAIYMEAKPSDLAIQSLYGPYHYTDANERRAAIIDAFSHGEVMDGILIDGLAGAARLDRDESAVTDSWTGPRLSPARILGDGMGIRCGFQTIAAIEALRDSHSSATVLASGGNQHAFSARLTRHKP